MDFGEIIDVRVKEVIVYVRDKDGNPVTGLTKDDFLLLEDGKPMPISNFSETVGGERADRDDEPQMTQLERIRSNPELDPRITSTVPEDERLYLTVYIDHQNIRPQNRNRVFRDLRTFLREKLNREDRVQLVSYTRSLNTVREWTADPALIARALFEEAERTGGRTMVDSDRRDLINEVDEGRNSTILESRTRLFAEEQFNDLRFTLDALRETIDNLAGVPGRKALLYVSDGLPMRAGEEMFTALVERGERGGFESGNTDMSNLRMQSFEYDASSHFRMLTSAANANGVTFYTLDAAGLMGRSMRGADMRGTGFSSSLESTWSSNMQTPLMFMADDTGGQFAVNTNNFDRVFDKMTTDFRYYYSLGYQPPHPGNGREYKIKVEIPNKRAKGVAEIRHAGSYRDKSPEKEMQEATLAGLQYNIQNNTLGLRLQERERIRSSDGNFVVHVDLLIPLGNVTILPRSEDLHVAQLQVWVQARDDEGGLSPAVQQEFAIPVPSADMPEIGDKYYAYSLPLQMAPGDQRLSIGVRDRLGGETSVVTQVFRLAS